MEAVESAALEHERSGDERSARGRTSAEKLLERLRSSGRLEQLETDLAQRKALDLVAESAKPITPGQAEAREKLWTPGS
jgi:trigger factor